MDVRLIQCRTQEQDAAWWPKPTTAEPPPITVQVKTPGKKHLDVNVQIKKTNAASQFWKPRIRFGSLWRFVEKTDEDTALVEFGRRWFGFKDTLADLMKTLNAYEQIYTFI